MDNTPQNIAQLIREKALALGFSACGFAGVRPLNEHREHFRRWLDDGNHGTMEWLANHFDKRLDPSQLVEGAKSVIVLLHNYFPAEKQKDPNAPIIAKYAYGKDYHHLLKAKLAKLFDYIQQEISPCSGRMFVDSAPVLERYWAREAGLGWIGKNSLLIHPRMGSFFFISELIIDIELPYDQPFTENHCCNCSRCIDACPTNAIVSPSVIDARKCISYHTIESKDEIHEEIKERLNGRFFGCDICQDVCPWNKKFATPHSEPELMPQLQLLDMDTEAWQNLDKPTYNQLFKKSAVQRAGYAKLLSNLKAAIQSKSF